MVWGVEAAGLAPRRQRTLRVALGRVLHLHSGGVLTFCIRGVIIQDPAYTIVLQHFRAVHELFHGSLIVCANLFAKLGALL